MMNLQTSEGVFKAAEGIANSDAFLTLEGLVASCGRLGDDEKVDLLEFLNGLRGVSRSREAIARSLRVIRSEGVW